MKVFWSSIWFILLFSHCLHSEIRDTIITAGSDSAWVKVGDFYTTGGVKIFSKNTDNPEISLQEEIKIDTVTKVILEKTVEKIHNPKYRVENRIRNVTNVKNNEVISNLLSVFHSKWMMVVDHSSFKSKTFLFSSSQYLVFTKCYNDFLISVFEISNSKKIDLSQINIRPPPSSFVA